MDIQNVQNNLQPTPVMGLSGKPQTEEARISDAFLKLLKEVEARRSTRGVKDEDTQARFNALVEKYLGPDGKEPTATVEPRIASTAPSPAPPVMVTPLPEPGSPDKSPAPSLDKSSTPSLAVGKSGQITYTVQSDSESLSEIAYKFYGKAGRYVDLARVNHIQNPDIIHAGQKLIIPEIDRPVEYAETAETARQKVNSGAGPMATQPTVPEKTAAETTYQVQSDSESLSEIAHRFYGKASRYMDIARANGIKNPDIIHAGQTLIIPGITRPGAPEKNSESQVAEDSGSEFAPKTSVSPLAAVPAFSETTDKQIVAPQLLHDGKPVRMNLEPAIARTENIPEKPTAETVQTYTVRRDDETLSEIAKKFYGKAGRYMDIARANGIKNPDIIHAGQKLVLPALDSVRNQDTGRIAATKPTPSEERKIFSMMLHFQGYQQLDQDYPRVMISDLPTGTNQEQL